MATLKKPQKLDNKPHFEVSEDSVALFVEFDSSCLKKESTKTL